MVDKLKIKCPNDGSILVVANRPDLERLVFRCPVCKQSIPFREFKLVTEQRVVDDESTNYGPLPSADNEATTFDNGNSDSTTYQSVSASGSIGFIVNTATGEKFKLHAGRNIIGRKALTSKANIQIAVLNVSKAMSREHLYIDVSEVKGLGIRRVLSLVKQMVNKTEVDNEKLEFGDKVVLSGGETILLPGATLKFVVDGE